MLHAANLFFFTFHIALVCFNLFGWLWPRARQVHLICVGLTWASWIILGIWYGFGYCPLTDWHWQVLRKLGKTDLPASYLKYLFDTITGLDISAGLIDTAAVVGLVLGTVMGVYVNFFRKRRVR